VIGPGQVIKLGGYQSGNNVFVHGSLQAQGTATEPIVFTSKQDDSAGGDTNNDGSKSSPQPGDWVTIQFTSTSTASMLDNVVVNYGGYSVGAEVEADGTSPTIENSTIANSAGGFEQGYGVQLIGSNAVLIGDTFLKDGLPGDGTGAIDMDQSSRPVISGITFTKNKLNGVSVEGGSLPAGTTTWNVPGVVFWLNANVTVPKGSTLVIDPGLVLKFGGLFSSAQLVVQGTLQAQGTAAQPIIFTSKNDESAGGDTNNAGSTGSPPGPGNWNGIQFASTSTANVLDHVEVRYAGQVGIDNLGAIETDGVPLTMTNSIERDGDHVGLIALTGSAVTLTSDMFVQNLTGLQFEAGSTDTVVNNTIDGNSIFGVILDSPTATLVNNLITNSGNTGVYQRGQTNLTMNFNDVFNPVATNGNYSGLTAPSGNLSVDPKYFNAAEGQYELHPGSPVEDAGTSVVSPGVPAPATDILGDPRFKDPNLPGRGDGSGYDMGAIEVQQVATSNVDLATTTVSGPATGIEGQSVTVDWTVQNVGAGTAPGSWHDAVYLSATAVFTPDAILLGEVQHTGDLGPGQSYNASGTFTLPGVVPGNDYFLVRANSRNEVFEGSALANNSLASTTPVAMDLPRDVQPSGQCHRFRHGYAQ
jgi:CARDB/Right handed beta helix region